MSEKYSWLKDFKWDGYLKYQELTDFLKECVETHPDLCDMYSIGKTWENRDIWCIELTNKKTGPGCDKPGVFVDGNTHAGEVTGCMTALYTVRQLLNNYSKSDEITTLLDTRVFYVVPRLSVDGAELYLTSTYIPRSSIRPWPYDYQEDGLYPNDVDGDGFIAQMRIEDENGEWRVSEKDPRVMVRRKPGEVGGKYYNILPEGLIQNFDGVEVESAPAKWGLDINRNYGANWQPDTVQRGAGPYPFSEPESRSIAEFFQTHKNVTIAQSYHTFSGAILRPPASRPDAEYSIKDLKAYREIGAMGTEVTGYPVVGVYEGFGLSKDLVTKRKLWGSALEWMFEHTGAIGYSTELWDMPNRAMGRNDSYKTLMDWTEDENVKMQKWNDENLNGEGFINWRPFDHPQLGKVELGGWKHKYVIQNPPPKFLEQECKKNTEFFLSASLATPLNRVINVESEEVTPGVYVVKATVRNMGYLPSNGTDQAIKVKVAEPVKAEIKVPEGVQVVSGKSEIELGHLEGRLTVGRAFGGATKKARLCRWVVKASVGTKITVRAGNNRGGYDEKTVQVG